MKRLFSRTKGAVAFLAVVGSTAALAQARPLPDPPPQNPDEYQQPGPGIGGSMSTTTVVTEQPQGGVTQVNPFGAMLLGGVEGYSGVLAPHLNAGFVGGVEAFYEPWKFLGFGLGYSGGVAYLKNNTAGGPDVVRNGGYAIVTPGLTFPVAEGVSLKPYLLGGIGLDGYNAQNGAPGAGWHNTTQGTIPFGLGLEGRADHVLASARFNYDWGFGDQFNPYTSEPLRYQAQLTVGGAF